MASRRDAEVEGQAQEWMEAIMEEVRLHRSETPMKHLAISRPLSGLPWRL